MFRFHARLTALALLLLPLTGCSTFDHDFDAARAAGHAPDGVEGAWAGNWESHNGHGGGSLRAIFTRTAPDTIHARFRSGFWKLFAAEDSVDFKATGTNPVHATGDADLGFLKGGVYHYDATITPTTFDATYTMKFDNGVFSMTRGK
jgi:hypothetical protein